MSNSKSIIKSLISFLLAVLIFLTIFLLCILIGSTGIMSFDISDQTSMSVLFDVRLPRVISAAIIGASLSICGTAFQGLLRNPLADGSTLGVSSGASLGAVLAIVASSAFPFLTQGFQDVSILLFSMIGAFVSLILIMLLAYKLDTKLSTNTIILVGVIFSMFASSFISLLVSLFPENAKTVTFWTMGSVSGTNYLDVIILLVFCTLCSLGIYSQSRELNTFSIGEENASHLGVNVKKTKIIIMVFVSILVGVCVSVSGTIGFVGLVVPHISRAIIGPNHKKLIPFTFLFGASFLMITDCVSRTIIAPKELPIGVITSLIGAVIFVIIFYRQRKKQN